MDDELKNLEEELQQLRPRNPSPGLQRRIAAALDSPRRSQAWGWAVLPLAAALAVMFILTRESVTPEQLNEAVMVEAAPVGSADEYLPVAVENVLYASHHDGLITLENGARVQRQRDSYVDTITWRNPLTNASLRLSVPREEVRVLPVTFQ